ncbi:hypothetical protein Poli38472_013186 [Pythium oligandrum]|uniref:Uncharacterized protein n=1 Tax=Pythium oligandrum TaxID=41045 RepID=A0A8K1C2M3_PYTOL|nr:hypothetical protein Poli38472_013186 [Pythium oligandrum]|eukprot:TMW55295.1 hypothetical protein Poli38472_013186 [Pythium oligandrum]
MQREDDGVVHASLSPTGASAQYQRVATPPAAVVAVSEAKLKNSVDPTDSEDDKEDANAKKNNFTFGQLYRYATTGDKIALGIGLIMTGINGALFSCMALVFGDAITNFQPYDADGVNRSALYFFLIAIALFVTDYFSYLIFHSTAERQVKALREEGLRHMLYLDITWYDKHDALQLSSRLNGDTVKIKDGMGQKLGDCIRLVVQFITGYVIGFMKGWEMSLIMSAVMPCIAISMAFLIKTLRTRTEWAQKIYAEAGAVAEETLGSMRTVASNNGERRAIDKYNVRARKAEEQNLALIRMAAVVLGVFFSSMWLMYASGLWYGGHKVSEGKSDPGKVFSAFYGILLGSIAMAQISPNISAVAQAKGAAAGLYEILSTPSAIDASSVDDGIIPGTCSGRIEAKNVDFSYPSRPDVPILSDYNVEVESGQTVAFVGASGGGKSTLISLLERFYDPSSGQIFLDGHDIRTLNVQWLRSQIGLVSQEPVLFATTISENIAFGHPGSSRMDVEDAARLANAHEFIKQLPQGYDTLVGEKGVSLSGGQKQRIAIARALVRKPKILVLDEATSALDNVSERTVQAALNSLMTKTNMTTLVIAHRLSTIRHVDKIVVLQSGAVAEEGSHNDLMKLPDGIYRNLFTIQAGSDNSAEGDDELAAASGIEDGVAATRLSRHHSDVSDRASQTLNNADIDSELSPSFTIRKALSLCRPERKYFILGSIGSAIVGASMPGNAILLSGILSSMTERYMLFQQTGDRTYLTDLYDKIQMYGAIYIGGAVIVFVSTAMQQYCFKYMAEKLASRLRDYHFTALCRQDIGFFDETKNATGALTADLSTNATKVAQLSGEALARMIQAAFTFVAAIIISFSLGSWLLTLVILVAFPFLIIGQAVRMQHMKGEAGATDELAESGAHASQALSNIRTVVSLGLEKWVINEYGELLLRPVAQGTRAAHINGLALGFSSFIMFAVYSLVFWYGGKLVHKDDITFQQLIRTLMAIMMSAQGIGSAASWIAESDNALLAGSSIFALVERKPSIDSFADEGTRLNKLNGKIEFRDIAFRYPTRPEVTVLRKYNLTVEAGQTVAFCGPSGGGKSTVISLLERFYDPVRGNITLDGHDLKTLNLRWLRGQIGLVGQEPTLFVGTVAENIAYGLETQPSQQEVEAAAKMANAHDFIANFPEGYETQVGNKGEQLSGGQKQRIAIARAILKNPKILLLDEATSALDSESEKVVQEALDKVLSLQKRTTIIIAHRLSTIRKADKICVVSDGHIAEQGTHTELLALNGIYARLVANSR